MRSEQSLGVLTCLTLVLAPQIIPNHLPNHLSKVPHNSVSQCNNCPAVDCFPIRYQLKVVKKKSLEEGSGLFGRGETVGLRCSRRK
jgi:hypothetical protein